MSADRATAQIGGSARVSREPDQLRKVALGRAVTRLR
jgi:hypothetical protein